MNVLKTPRDFALEHWNSAGADIDVDDATELLTQDRADIRAVLRGEVTKMKKNCELCNGVHHWECEQAHYDIALDDILTLIDTLLPGDVSK